MQSRKNVHKNADTIKHFNEAERTFEVHYLINMQTCKGLSSPAAAHKHTELIIPVMPSMVIKCWSPACRKGVTEPIGKTFVTIGFAIKENFISGFAEILHSRA